MLRLTVRRREDDGPKNGNRPPPPKGEDRRRSQGSRDISLLPGQNSVSSEEVRRDGEGHPRRRSQEGWRAGRTGHARAARNHDDGGRQVAPDDGGFNQDNQEG